MRPGDRPVPARVGATDAGRQCRTNSAVVQLGLPPGRSAGARLVCTRGSTFLDPILRPVLALLSAHFVLVYSWFTCMYGI